MQRHAPHPSPTCLRGARRILPAMLRAAQGTSPVPAAPYQGFPRSFSIPGSWTRAGRKPGPQQVLALGAVTAGNTARPVPQQLAHRGGLFSKHSHSAPSRAVRRCLSAASLAFFQQVLYSCSCPNTAPLHTVNGAPAPPRSGRVSSTAELFPKGEEAPQMGIVCSWEALQVPTASAEKFQLCFLWPRARIISGSRCHDMIATFIFILRHRFLYLLYSPQYKALNSHHCCCNSAGSQVKPNQPSRQKSFQAAAHTC